MPVPVAGRPARFNEHEHGIPQHFHKQSQEPTPNIRAARHLKTELLIEETHVLLHHFHDDVVHDVIPLRYFQQTSNFPQNSPRYLSAQILRPCMTASSPMPNRTQKIQAYQSQFQLLIPHQSDPMKLRVHGLLQLF